MESDGLDEKLLVGVGCCGGGVVAGVDVWICSQRFACG